MFFPSKPRLPRQQCRCRLKTIYLTLYSLVGNRLIIIAVYNLLDSLRCENLLKCVEGRNECMGMLSLILTVVGIVGMLVHYALTAMPAVIVTGILTAVAFIAAYILGTVDMRRQAANGGIRADMFNPAMLGHGMSGTLLVVGAIMCVIANIM